MKAGVHPGYINGTIRVPASKSMTQRVYAAAMLHGGRTVVRNAGKSNDEQAALRVIQQLGAGVEMNEDGTLTITSAGLRPAADTVDCGESGLAARLFAPIAALHNAALTITGSGSLMGREMDGMGPALAALGASVTMNGSKLPATICGPVVATDVAVDGSSGSQLVSGLLFALAFGAKHAVTLTVKGLKSKPYIDMTLEVLAKFGREVRNDGYRKFVIDPANFTAVGDVDITIEGDWSAASCLVVAAAIGGQLRLQGLQQASVQADRGLLDVVTEVGAYVSWEGDDLVVKKQRRRWFEFDATDCPDLFPALAILAACCKGDSHIAGVHRLFNKESNRVESIAQMLEDLGVFYSVENDEFAITGEDVLRGTIVESYNDHRIVMAAAAAATRAKSIVEIEGAEAVRKSYPDFFRDLSNCNLHVDLADADGDGRHNA